MSEELKENEGVSAQENNETQDSSTETTVDEKPTEVSAKSAAPKAVPPMLETLLQGYDKEVVIEGVPFKISAVTGLQVVLLRTDIHA